MLHDVKQLELIENPTVVERPGNKFGDNYSHWKVRRKP